MSYLLDKDDKTITQDAWDTVRYYEELNTTNFPIIEPNVIRKLRQRKMMAKNLVYSLSNDTLEIVTPQHRKD